MKHNTKHENSDYEEFGANSRNTIMHQRQYNKRNTTTNDSENMQDLDKYDFRMYDKATQRDEDETKGRNNVADFGDILQDDEIGSADLANLA